MSVVTNLNPLGVKHSSFELVIKPGILAKTMNFWFIPYWNSGGYCKVDWGDDYKEEAIKSGSKLNHIYNTSGVYTVKINANCYRVDFSDAISSIPIIAYCSGNWEELGYLTTNNCMFRGCSNMEIDCNELPEGLVRQLAMFAYCSKASLPLIKLPNKLQTGHNMFVGCSNAILPLTELPESLTNVLSMFSDCINAKFSFSTLPSRVTNCSHLFNNCKNANLSFSKLPDGLTNANNMFRNCINARMNLDVLAENAPANGWSNLTSITGMFYGCVNVTGSRSAFLSKCPSNVSGIDSAFINTNTVE